MLQLNASGQFFASVQKESKTGVAVGSLDQLAKIAIIGCRLHYQHMDIYKELGMIKKNNQFIHREIVILAR